MKRVVVGFHQDTEGDWVADLDCLHGQHVWHRPPFQQRPWTLTEEGRRSRLGAEVDCPLCDRFELPTGLQVHRTAGPFGADALPDGLRRRHRVPPGSWGVLRIIDGSVRLRLDTDPPIVRRLGAGEDHPLPPEVAHALMVDGPAVVAVDFLVRPETPRIGRALGLPEG